MGTGYGLQVGYDIEYAQWQCRNCMETDHDYQNCMGPFSFSVLHGFPNTTACMPSLAVNALSTAELTISRLISK